MHPHGNRPVEENSIPAMMEKFGVHSMDVIQSFRSSFPKLNGKSREGLYYCFQETFLMTLLKDLSSKRCKNQGIFFIMQFRIRHYVHGIDIELLPSRKMPSQIKVASKPRKKSTI